MNLWTMTCFLLIAMLVTGAGAFAQVNPLEPVDPYALSPDAMTLVVNGSCPGQMTAYVEGAPPNSRVALLYANDVGNATLYGLCAGLVLGLDRSVRVVDVQDTNANGEVGFGGSASSRACGGYLQAWDYNECLLSNVAPIN